MNDEGNQAVKSKAECFKVTTIFIFIIIPFKYALLTKREDSIWPYYLFCILLDFLEVLYFFLVGYATRLRRSFYCCGTSCIEARLRSLLRTYERLTCSKSSILFTETSRRQYPVFLTSLVNKGFILWPCFRGFDSQRFVLLLTYLFE